MRVSGIPIVFLGMLLLATAGSLPVWGQSALDQLQQRLEAAPPAAPSNAPSTAPAVPGTGYLGAILDDAKPPQKGVLVASVKTDGPAARGGLREGDLIVQIAGKPVAGLTDLDEVLDQAVPGQSLQITVEREGKSASLTVTLGTRPAPPAESTAPSLLPPASPGSAPPALPAPTLPPPGSSPANAPPPSAGPTISSPASAAPPASSVPSPAQSTPVAPADELPPPAPTEPRPSRTAADRPAGGATLGITVVTLTDDARMTYGVPVARGALITGIRPGSPADQAGLPLGGVIVSIDGRRVDSSDDLVAAIRAARPGQVVELTYFDGNRLTRKEIRLAGSTAAAAPGAPVGPAAPAVDQPPPSRLLPGVGGSRPLLGRVERMVEGFTRPGATSPAGPSTVYDPLAMAELQQKVAELTAEVASLKERIKALEERLGGSAPPGTPPSGRAPSGAAPGFEGPPASNPRTPGFAAPEGTFSTVP